MRALILVAVLLVGGCLTKEPPTGEPSPLTPPSGPAFMLTSPAFAEGGTIPRDHSCDGAGKSPPLDVEGAPRNATTLALLVGDPDAPFPQAPTQNFTHWVLWNAPLVDGTTAFPEGGVPRGTVEGASGSGNGWTPPCPPQASTAHRYVFTAFAVDGPLTLKEGASRADLENALKGRVLGTTMLTGTYARSIP